MVGMEIIESQEAWNAVPVNSYAILTSRHEGRTETLFISRCAEDRGTMSGNHMIAGGKHWTDQFATAETAGVLYRAGDANGPRATTQILRLKHLQAAATYETIYEVRAYVARAVKGSAVLPDRIALWLITALSSTGDFPALMSLHSTGSAYTDELRDELLAIQARDRHRHRFAPDMYPAQSAADRIAAMLSWIDAR